MNNHKKGLLWALALSSTLLIIGHPKKDPAAPRSKKTMPTKTEKFRREKEKPAAPYRYKNSYRYGSQAPRDRLHWHENQQDLDAAFKLNTITQPEPARHNQPRMHKKRSNTHHQPRKGPKPQRRHQYNHRQKTDQYAIAR